MKKNPIIFIAMLIALAFTSCQMNTDDADNILDSSYAVAIAENLKDGSANGKITTDKEAAKAGETVKLTITPDSGYVLDSLSVKTSDTEITATIADDKTSATFTMPEGDVKVEASFKTTTATPAPTTPTEATSYTVVYGDQTIGTGLTNTDVNSCISQFGLVETTDYSINKTTGIITLTASGYEKVKSYIGNGNLPATTTTEPTDTNNGGEDDGTGGNTNPPATTEYTVSVADGIKGGHIEVSTDKETWTKLSTSIMFAKTSVRYKKGTNVYVRAVANNSFYKLKIMNYTSSKDEGGVLANGASNCITIDADITLNATFVMEQRDIETLKGEITSGNAYKDNLKCGVIPYYKGTFTDTYNNVKIVFGFSENYYKGLTASTSDDDITYKSGDKPDYYYVFNTEITEFSKTQGFDRVFVSITGNNFILPDTGRIYVLAETKEGNKIMFPAKESFSANEIKFAVEIH